MPEDELHSIRIHLDRLLAERGMTLTELSEKVGITVVNLSVLKNGRAKAVRFSTLSRICEVLRCQPGDLITHDAGKGDEGEGGRA
ncbi:MULTISPECIES: helix-turn-helix transcriptional regulator [Streptomyces]|uniref:Transcriptional regulator n=1 Tax=Streptomyces venezuelae TaxID=54571 RepID=A0A5P2BKH2_STRVZ|nr:MULTISPECIES: helix-turn-helix transcriptional regulator [Streptomyces]NDZ99390.1 helix-turn-helix transcriptional regulator [Streptomyces sp. SID10116]MYY85277.1 helix-turn-helix domain-containing protein [Streptomyces sp. SID335]MYZ12985.1 helix-turn-helix domain-containing protein [Streptomyces sp. SID337]NDZ85262.1 helix-turn-helix transcriptional regulator [Streptomyces sp. SID10115]NEB46895.1 helix-turn-helix transcriptional regulator [Streptomyces sp. SID339]